MKRRVIATIASVAVAIGVSIGAAPARAESKCPVWMCGANGTELTGLQLASDPESADRIASNGTQLTGIELPVTDIEGR
jgi:hypothetical protein